MQDTQITSRTLKTSSFVTVGLTAWLFCAGRNGWAWGFLIGALLSLFSLFTLKLVVTALVMPKAPSLSQGLLLLTLFMKLPLYMVGLYAVTHLRGVTPTGAVFGIALVPLVITLKTLGGLITANAPEKTAQQPVRAAHAETKPHSLVKAQPVREGT